MFELAGSSTPPYCDGLPRRDFVKLGLAGLASLSLPQIMQARAQAKAPGNGKQTRLILIWLDGGPSHMDLYDLKPDAPSEYRGIWRPIRTVVPGMEISELFPKQAQVADKFSIIRSLRHGTGDHFDAAHQILTGRFGATGADTRGRYPFVGAAAAHLLGPRRPNLPSHVAVPVASSVGLRPGYFGANYLGAADNPFETEGDPNADGFQVRNINLAGGLSVDRLDDRKTLLAQLDQAKRLRDNLGVSESLDRFTDNAFELVTGAAARDAFDLSKEDAPTRDRYGRNTWGQSVLLARRLAEAGCTVVTVHLGGWDHHWNLKSAMEDYLPKVDAAVAALFTDLSDRHLQEDVMVMMLGEFSRTPRMNDGGNGGAPMSMGTPGRDHWGNAMFCLIGGGGIRGGQVIGKTDRLGEEAVDRVIRPGDLHATLFHCLGIDPYTSFPDHSGRPTTVVEHGELIQELV